MTGSGNVLAFGQHFNLSTGDKFFGFVCMAFLLWMLLFECKAYVKSYKNPEEPKDPRPSLRVMVVATFVLFALKIGAVWGLWHISSFNYRTITALVLTAANLVYLSVDLLRMRKYGINVPLERSKRSAYLWVTNNIVEILLIILIAFG